MVRILLKARSFGKHLAQGLHTASRQTLRVSSPRGESCSVPWLSTRRLVRTQDRQVWMKTLERRLLGKSWMCGWHSVTKLGKSSGMLHRLPFQKSLTGGFHLNRRLNRSNFPENVKVQDRSSLLSESARGLLLTIWACGCSGLNAPPHSYVKALTSKVAVFGDRAFRR